MAKRAACLTLYWLKFNVALDNNIVSQSYLWPRGETSRSVRAVIEKPQDSLLTQHTMWTADTEDPLNPLVIKYHRQHIVSLSL